MKTNFNKSGVFFILNALKMSEITVFDEIDEEVAVLPSFLKGFLEFNAYDSFIAKREYTMKYQEIQGNTLTKTLNIKKYLNIVGNT
jgi:hypothetical protein